MQLGTNRFRQNKTGILVVIPKQIEFFALLFPALFLCSVFIFVPAIVAVIGSFFRIGFASTVWRFVGLANYVRAFTDPIFYVALRNNLIIAVGSVVLQVGSGLFLATILDRGLPRFSTVFRTIIFMPQVISLVAASLMWMMVLEPNIGILTNISRALGLPTPAHGWLGDPKISIWILLMICYWYATGFMMVLLLAGLQNIPQEIYEAASLDGARGFKLFLYITLPCIFNVLLVAVLITIIGGIKVFDLVYATTRGGPANATQVLGTYIYLQAFELGNMGYANALSVLLLIVAVILGTLQLKATRRK